MAYQTTFFEEAKANIHYHFICDKCCKESGELAFELLAWELIHYNGAVSRLDPEKSMEMKSKAQKAIDIEINAFRALDTLEKKVIYLSEYGTKFNNLNVYEIPPSLRNTIPNRKFGRCPHCNAKQLWFSSNKSNTVSIITGGAILAIFLYILIGLQFLGMNAFKMPAIVIGLICIVAALTLIGILLSQNNRKKKEEFYKKGIENSPEFVIT